MQQVIFGNCPSKSNSYRIGQKKLLKTEDLKSYERNFILQCNRYKNKNINKPFRLDLVVYFAAMKQDLDNSFKVILDCLQSCKAISNDNLCMEIVARKEIDAKNPRIEFKITEL